MGLIIHETPFSAQPIDASKPPEASKTPVAEGETEKRNPC